MSHSLTLISQRARASRNSRWLAESVTPAMRRRSLETRRRSRSCLRADFRRRSKRAPAIACGWARRLVGTTLASLVPPFSIEPQDGNAHHERFGKSVEVKKQNAIGNCGVFNRIHTQSMPRFTHSSDSVVVLHTIDAWFRFSISRLLRASRTSQ